VGSRVLCSWSCVVIPCVCGALFADGISARSDLPVNVPLQQVLHNTEFVCGKVTSVTPHTVEVNYQKIPFDYLVVASGARARSMLKPQCVSAAHRVGSISAQAQSASVSSLLVVGSGPSAVEYAAVAKSARPSLDVTLCCDATRLLPRIKDGQAVHDEVLSRLTDLGVHVRLHTRLVGSGNNEGTFAVANSSYACHFVFVLSRVCV
jgi:NADPH-dependent 2,4-dienoyl-CoA reductase/sulfur reductase-like enzyme